VHDLCVVAPDDPGERIFDRPDELREIGFLRWMLDALR